MLFTLYSIIITVAWIVVSTYVLIKSNSIAFLKNVKPEIIEEPKVDIIIPVKDEEKEIRKALQSVCNLDYSNYTITVVNDRSTDNTASILKDMATENPSIKVITITDLPEGWLGKNHALYKGYQGSNGQWLLFTDADILYNKQALNKAMNYAITNDLDNLTALPEITSPSPLFVSVMNTFAIMLEIRLRPWNVSNPSSKASIGIGAFNLVKRKAYEKAGTHKTISLRPDDDLKLGESIKKAGLKQDVVYGEKEISLDWYANLNEFVKGLMKNTFAVAEYNPFLAVAMAMATFLVFVLPVPLLLLTGSSGLAFGGLIILSQMMLMSFKRGINGKWWHALIIPFSGAVLMYIIIISAWKTMKQGGIYWRGTFYSLDELKKQQ